MSGGHFNYSQHRIRDIADEVEDVILKNDSTEYDEYDYPVARSYNPEVIAHFKVGLDLLYMCEIYVQRMDWLLSGDDGEDSFLSRLKSDLEALERSK